MEVPSDLLSAFDLVLNGPRLPARDGAWRVRCGSDLAVLRRHALATEQVRADLAWLHAYLDQLSRHHFPAPAPFHGFDGASVVEHDGALWELISYLPGRTIDWSRHAPLADIGTLLGCYHLVARRISVVEQRPLAVPLDSLHLNLPHDADTVRRWVEVLRGDLEQIGHDDVQRLVVHGDFTAHNVLTSSTSTAPVSGVIDFALAYLEAPLADLGFGLWRAGRPAQDAIELAPTRIRAFVTGYAREHDEHDLPPAAAEAIAVYIRARGIQQAVKACRNGRPIDPLRAARIAWLDANRAMLRDTIGAAIEGHDLVARTDRGDTASTFRQMRFHISRRHSPERRINSGDEPGDDGLVTPTSQDASTVASWQRGLAGGRSHRPLPLVAALSCLTYALAHAWWTLTDAPEFVRIESVFVGGWLVVGVAAAATMVCVGIAAGRQARWPTALKWSWCGIGWMCSAALAAYCLILWPSLAHLLMVPFGEAMDRNELGALILRALGTSAAVLTAASTRRVVRELRAGCPACGRVHGRPPETRETGTSRWGYVGGYLAVIGLIIRMVPALIDWSAPGGSMEDEPGGWGFLLFIGLMILAGTLLPLALVHRWGRIWPAWVPFWAGQPVPRRVVLGPGMMMSLGLLAYFGAGGVTATILGKTSGHPMEALEIAAYVLWGIGLAIACRSYARLTRPPCPDALVTIR